MSKSKYIGLIFSWSEFPRGKNNSYETLASLVLGRQRCLLDARLIFFKQPSVNAEQNIQGKETVVVANELSSSSVPGGIALENQGSIIKGRLPVIPTYATIACLATAWNYLDVGWNPTFFEFLH